MQHLDILPYIPVGNTDYPSPVTLDIKREHFNGIVKKEGESTYNFHGCFFKKIIIENHEDIEFEEINISFVDCFIEDIWIEDIISKNITINFSSCIIAGKISAEAIERVSLNNVIVQGIIFLIDQKSAYISYTQENIFPIRWLKLFRKLKIKKITELLKIKQSFHFNDTQKVIFSSNERDIKSNGLIRDDLHTSFDHKFKYYLNNDEKNYLNINLSITYSKKINDSEVEISNSRLNSFSITGKQEGTLKIEDSKIQRWYLRDYTPNGETIFYNIKPLTQSEKSLIDFHICHLENLWFDTVKFSEYKDVVFHRTRFGKSKFTSCSFPNTYTSFEKFNSLRNAHLPNEKPDDYYKDLYEIFLQLKNALESTGNFYEAQKLQAISNDALRKIEDVNWLDKIILYINSKSNNHGLSIVRPFIGFLLFSIFFYVLYLLSINRIFIYTEFDPTLIGYYFSFIDLTHRSDFLVEKTEFTSFSLTIDFINKLVAGFFIYQFVAAFRKYGKK